MLNLYHLEKKKIIESYERRKPFFVGELQQSVRREYTYDFEGNRIPRKEDDYIEDRAIGQVSTFGLAVFKQN